MADEIDPQPPAAAEPAAPRSAAPRADEAAGRPRRGARQQRRSVLRTLLLGGGVTCAALSGYLPLAYARQERLRPPGALEERDFLSSCIKCGQCLQVCPVQAIRLGDLVDGFGVGVPYIDPRDQACDFSCDAAQCILACPTGALTYEPPPELSRRPGAQLEAKPVLKARANDRDTELNFRQRMGVARLSRPESCLATKGEGFKGPARGPDFAGKLRYTEVDRWKPIPVREHPYDLKECDLCVEACPVKGAITFENFTGTDGIQRRRPAVLEPCVGCGVCAMVCPVEPGCISIDARAGWKA